MRGKVLLISGPSGSGKSSILKEVMNKIDEVYFSISTTTRSIRDGELNGREYHFENVNTFKKDIEKGRFLEYANVHGNYYGTYLKPITEALINGKLVIFDIDVQGYEQIKNKFKDIITSIFITTKDANILKDRLVKRNTDSIESIENRLNNAKTEIKHIHNYDYVIVNKELEKSVSKVLKIIEVLKLKKSQIELNEFIFNWQGD